MSPRVRYDSLSRNSNVEAQIQRAWTAHLEKMSQWDRVPAHSAVVLMSNLAFLKRNLGAGIFGRIDSNPISEEHAVVLSELSKKIDDGILPLNPPERIRAGRFTVQFNEIRGFRPAREGARSDVRIDETFPYGRFNFFRIDKSEKFHFLWINGMAFHFYLNMYPFAPYHFSLLPQMAELKSQSLDGKRDVLKNVCELVKRCPNMRIGFNALGTHASVNHLHFQGFFAEGGWQVPIDEHLKQHGSLMDWPLKHSVWISAFDRGPVGKTLKHIQGYTS